MCIVSAFWCVPLPLSVPCCCHQNFEENKQNRCVPHQKRECSTNAESPFRLDWWPLSALQGFLWRGKSLIPRVLVVHACISKWLLQVNSNTSSEMHDCAQENWGFYSIDVHTSSSLTMVTWTLSAFTVLCPTFFTCSPCCLSRNWSFPFSVERTLQHCRLWSSTTTPILCPSATSGLLCLSRVELFRSLYADYFCVEFFFPFFLFGCEPSVWFVVDLYWRYWRPIPSLACWCRSADAAENSVTLLYTTTVALTGLCDIPVKTLTHQLCGYFMQFSNLSVRQWLLYWVGVS